MTEQPPEDSIEQLVTDLRRLWERTGAVPFTAISRRVEVSKSSLNDAVNRTDRLVTERVLRALVGFLDPPGTEAWVQRRARLESQLRKGRETPAPLTAPGGVAPEQAAHVGDRPRRRGVRRGLVAAVVGTVIAAALGFVAGRATAPITDGTAGRSAPGFTNRDGQDPEATNCSNDGFTIARTTVPDRARLEIRYSRRCQTIWARLTRLDGLADGNSLRILLKQRSDPSRVQTADDPDFPTNYTYMLSRIDGTIQYCATGTVLTGGKAFSLSVPDRPC